MSLSKPPERDTPSRAVGRIFFLLILALAAGAVIYTAVVNQRIELVENRRTAGLDLANTSEVDGLTINVAFGEGSGTPVVMLHDADVTGSLLLADVSESLGDGYILVRIDMPGFGLSDRMPFETQAYTATGMADIIAEVIEDQLSTRVVVVGVGYGGEVAAEIAHSHADLVRGVVMVDVDFGSGSSSSEYLMRFPWIGEAATYTWETGGSLATDNWQPYCDDGGWCATPQNLADRSFYVTIAGSTGSLHEYHRTPSASLASANLDDIAVPMAYVWSVDGSVSEGAVDNIAEEIPGLIVLESSSYQAHLEDPARLVEAIDAVGS